MEDAILWRKSQSIRGSRVQQHVQQSRCGWIKGGDLCRHSRTLEVITGTVEAQSPFRSAPRSTSAGAVTGTTHGASRTGYEEHKMLQPRRAGDGDSAPVLPSSFVRPK